MFGQCLKILNINISSFDTSNVTNMGSMFTNCRVLSSLDLSTFNTSNVTGMNMMFFYCFDLKTVKVSPTFIVDQVTNSTGMFDQCYDLVGGNGTVWSSSNPIDKTYAHIDGGTSNPGYFTAA